MCENPTGQSTISSFPHSSYKTTHPSDCSACTCFSCPPGPEAGQEAGHRQRHGVPVTDADLGHQLKHVFTPAKQKKW